MRIIALTPKVFFSCPSWHNVVDFFVVILAIIATIAGIVIINSIPESDKEVLTIIPFVSLSFAKSIAKCFISKVLPQSQTKLFLAVSSEGKVGGGSSST